MFESDRGSAATSDHVAETSWLVSVRWLPWRPGWQRRSLREWGTDAVVPAFIGREALATGLFSIVVAVVLGVVIFSVGLVLAIATWIAVLAGLMASAVGHFVARHPFLVEARSTTGAWAGWWVVGWRPARRVRTTVELQLHRGTPLARIHPGDARPAGEASTS